MGKMSDVGWMALFVARGATDGVASIRLEEAQAYVEVGDRVGVSGGPARRAGGVIERLSPRLTGAVRR